MTRIVRATVCVLVLVLLAACASTQPVGRSSTRSDLLTREQLLDSNYPSLFEAIQALRSNWLRARGVDSIQGPANEVIVYVDDQRLGGIYHLRSIATSSVARVRRFSAAEASARWGLGHGAGVLAVYTQVGNP